MVGAVLEEEQQVGGLELVGGDALHLLGLRIGVRRELHADLGPCRRGELGAVPGVRGLRGEAVRLADLGEGVVHDDGLGVGAHAGGRRTAGVVRATIVRSAICGGGASGGAGRSGSESGGGSLGSGLGLRLLHPPVGVLKQRIPAVDDDVPFFQVRSQLLDKAVHRLARFHQQHDPAGFLELGDQLLDRLGSLHLGALGLFGQEVVHLGDGAIVGHHDVAVVVHVEDEVLPHHRQADQADVSLRIHRKFLAENAFPAHRKEAEGLEPRRGELRVDLASPVGGLSLAAGGMKDHLQLVVPD